MSTASEQQRFECEARGWLKRGYNDTAGIERLKALLKDQGRSDDSINKLIEEMRRQWKRRAEWQGGPG